MEIVSLTPDLKELTAHAITLQKQADPDAAEAHVAAERDRFRKQFTYDNTYVASGAAEAAFLGEKRLAYDNTLEVNLKLWDLAHAEAVSNSQQAIAASQAPPRERDPILHELRVLNLREQFRGRRLVDVLELYRSIDDGSNPTATQLIETAREQLQLTPEKATDDRAAIALEALIKERRAARVPAALREQLKGLTALRTETLSAFVQYAKDGVLAVATAKHRHLRKK